MASFASSLRRTSSVNRFSLRCSVSLPLVQSSFLYSFLFLFLPAAPPLLYLRFLNRFSTASSFPMVPVPVSTPQISGQFCFGCMRVAASQLCRRCFSIASPVFGYLHHPVIGHLFHPANGLPHFKRDPVIPSGLLFSILGYLIQDAEIWGFRASIGIGLCCCDLAGFSVIRSFMLMGSCHRRLCFFVLIQQPPVLHLHACPAGSDWGFCLVVGCSSSACLMGSSCLVFFCSNFLFLCLFWFLFSCWLWLWLKVPGFTLRPICDSLDWFNGSLIVVVSKFLKASTITDLLISRVVYLVLLMFAPFAVFCCWFLLGLFSLSLPVLAMVSLLSHLPISLACNWFLVHL